MRKADTASATMTTAIRDAIAAAFFLAIPRWTTTVGGASRRCSESRGTLETGLK
jgi:hypothetical protein